ncbi:hypothetical protein [Streptomyces sp. NPDC005046]
MAEHLLSAANEGVEGQGWQLESVTSYGGALPTCTTPPYGHTARFWALLVFRTMYRSGHRVRPPRASLHRTSRTRFMPPKPWPVREG